MIPLVGKVEEFTILKDNTHKVAAAVMKEQKMKFKYMVGTMIEVAFAGKSCGGAVLPVGWVYWLRFSFCGQPRKYTRPRHICACPSRGRDGRRHRQGGGVLLLRD